MDPAKSLTDLGLYNSGSGSPIHFIPLANTTGTQPETLKGS